MEKYSKIIAGICILFIGIAVFLFYRQQNSVVAQESCYFSDNTAVTVSEQPVTADVRQEQDSAAQSASEEYAVYITGAVKHPGLYHFSGNARVSDALDAVGGFKKNAAKESVNLARVLTDGEQITIPTKKQWKKEKQMGMIHSTGNSSDGSHLDKINLNTASKEQLMTIPGIGESKATAIINYRTEQGGFAKPEDIMNITGIKEGVYRKIKDYIIT